MGPPTALGLARLEIFGVAHAAARYLGAAADYLEPLD